MKKAYLFLTLPFIFFACGGEKKENKTNDGTETAKAIEVPADIKKKLSEYTCATCHKPDEKLIGPSYKEIAQKGYPNAKMVALIYNPQPANWPGYTTMPPMNQVPPEDALAIAAWINTLK